MPLSLLAVIVDCRDPRRQAEWWAHALAYQVSQRNPDEFLVSDPAGAGGTLYFMKAPEPKVGKNRLHLDVVTSGSMEAEVARLVEAGAELVEVECPSAARNLRPMTEEEAAGIARFGDLIRYAPAIQKLTAS